MDVGEWESARDMARDDAIRHDKFVWNTSTMGYKGDFRDVQRHSRRKG